MTFSGGGRWSLTLSTALRGAEHLSPVEFSFRSKASRKEIGLSSGSDILLLLHFYDFQPVNKMRGKVRVALANELNGVSPGRGMFSGMPRYDKRHKGRHMSCIQDDYEEKVFLRTRYWLPLKAIKWFEGM